MKLTARWIMIDIPPTSQPPCTARFGFLSTALGFPVLGDITVADCQDVPDAIAKCEAVMQEMGVVIGDDFDLIYPRYAVDGRDEAAMHEIAWIIKDEADRRGYGFEREIPGAVFQKT